jgi:hypothetical protein
MLFLPFGQTVQPGLEFRQSGPPFRRKQGRGLLELWLAGLLQHQQLAHALLHGHAAQEARFFRLECVPAFSHCAQLTHGSILLLPKCTRSSREHYTTPGAGRRKLEGREDALEIGAGRSLTRFLPDAII